MTDFSLLYPAGASLVALTWDLTSLATSSTLLVGRASTAVVNTGDRDLDHLVSGFFKTGSASTAAGVFEVWAYAQIAGDNTTPIFPDSITGADAGKTFGSRNIIFSGLRLLDAIEVPGTNNITYPWGPYSIADAFGKLPRRWGLFGVHNLVGALSSTGADHAALYDRIKQTDA